jgi:CheY-like chemotaxis protein
VLVVDDEPQMRRALRRVLAGHGYEVELAEGGEAALAALAERGADAVVLDLMMPDLDGFAVLRRARAWSAVPILVLSVRGGGGRQGGRARPRGGRLPDQAVRGPGAAGAPARPAPPRRPGRRRPAG